MCAFELWRICIQNGASNLYAKNLHEIFCAVIVHHKKFDGGIFVLGKHTS